MTTATDKSNADGELAMRLISDYPLYAHTDGITYEEAIKIALVLFPDKSRWQEELDADE